MNDSEPRLTRAQAIEKIGDVLCLVATETELLSVAAYGLAWRDKRIAELERMVIRRGGWPWPKPRNKRTNRRGARSCRQ